MCRKESPEVHGTRQEITRQLVKSKRVLQRLHFRIAVLWTFLALVGNFWCGFWTYRCYEQSYADPDVDEELLMKVFCRILCDMRIVLISLVPLADTGTFARTIFIIEVVMLLVIRCLAYTHCRYGYDIPQLVWCISQVVVSVLATSVLLPGLRPEQVNSIMLKAIGLVLAIQVLDGLIWTVFFGIGEHIRMTTYYMVPDLVAMLVFLRRSWQRRMWQQLRFMLEGRVVSNGAACIAGLIGQCQPAEAVRDGRQRFKAVGLDAVSFEVLADSQPNPAYSSLAAACDLGHCDAFLSHSWHDDAGAKWKALQSWRTNFVAEHGREPKVWLDKCSIDQNRIDVDLRCLPVFLMGCSRLVLLVGPTYLSRLWCILELFTYVHMGGRLEDVDLVLVLREGHEEEDTQTINSSFQSFDAGGCQCACVEEKGRLLAIIQTAFGSMEEFNVAIRAIAKNVQQQCSAEASV